MSNYNVENTHGMCGTSVQDTVMRDLSFEMGQSRLDRVADARRKRIEAEIARRAEEERLLRERLENPVRRAAIAKSLQEIDAHIEKYPFPTYSIDQIIEYAMPFDEYHSEMLRTYITNKLCQAISKPNVPLSVLIMKKIIQGTNLNILLSDKEEIIYAARERELRNDDAPVQLRKKL